MRCVQLMRLGVAVMSLLALLTMVPGMAAQAECPGNVAVNASFEDGFSERGSGEVIVANGWTQFFQDGPDQDKGYNRRPEFKPVDGGAHGHERIHHGNWSQKWFTVYSTHHAGVLQQINVAADSVVTLSAWGQSWSSAQDNPKKSNDGAYELSVGIDPTGGTDFGSPNVVWSPKNGTMDAWVQLQVQATAKSGTITIFLRGDAIYRVKHNDAYFDDVCVTYLAPTPRPKPKAADTPVPTDAPEPSATPEVEPTEEPAEAPTAPPPTNTPVAGAISVYAFDDLNGNGLREEGEPLLAGAGIELQSIEGHPIETYMTTGSGEPYEFGSLGPGTYIVVERDPPGYVSTSPNHWAVVLPLGAAAEIHFADQFEPTPTATHTLAPTPSPEPTAAATAISAVEPEEPSRGLADSFSQVSGILVAMLALVIPIIYRLIRFQV